MKRLHKQVLSLLLSAALIFTMLPATARAEELPSVQDSGAASVLSDDASIATGSDALLAEDTLSIGVTEYDYVDDSGNSHSTAATVIDSASTMLTDGWYIVDSNVTIDHALTISGDVNLILADGYTLQGTTWDSYINVTNGNSLTIFGQENGTGKLDIPGIGGGSGGDCGMVTINGGTIKATGVAGVAGIGGGSGGSGGTITINGGTVTATGGIGAAIGGGSNGSGGVITINGGTVTATSGQTGIGGGGGSGGSGGTITINGGMVTATGTAGAGIGKDEFSSGGTITINGGTVTAASTFGAGIDGVCTITGGSVCVFSMKAVPADVQGNPLSRTEVELENVTAITQITSLTLSTGSYGIKDMYTDGGFLYLWLPSGTAVTGAETAGQRYAGSAASGETGILHAMQPSVSPALRRFFQNAPGDVTVTKNDWGYPLTGVYNGSAPLVKGTDYSVINDTITLKKEYLQTLPIGITALIFDFGLSNKNPMLRVFVEPQNQAACLAIGDSIASGYGLPGYAVAYPPQTLPNDAYTTLVSKELNLRSEGITFDGMTSDDLRTVLTGSGMERDMFMEYLSHAKVVTLSVGSNDILQPFLESVCGLLPGCQDVQDIPAVMAELRSDPDGWSFFHGQLPNSLKNYLAAIHATDNFKENFPEIIAAIKAVAPEAKIYVTNLYNPYKNVTLADVNGVNPLDFGALADGYIQEMNKAFDPSSQDYTLIDAYSAFSASLAGGTSPVNASLASFNFDPHPNKAGHALIANLILTDYHSGSEAPSVSPNSLTVGKGGTGSLTLDFGKGTASATEATITVADGAFASVATATATASGTITVTGLEAGTTNIIVTFNDAAHTVKTVPVTVLPELIWANGSTLSASNITSTGVILSWPPVLGSSGMAARYRIYQNRQVIAIVEGGTNVSYTVNNLSPSTAYLFQVQAGTSGGWWTTDGPSVTVTTSAASSRGKPGGGSSNVGTGDANIVTQPEKQITPVATKFTDIVGHWAKESIDYVVGRGLLTGTSNTTFSPDAAMTRGMLVTALGRLAGADVSIYKTNSFTDVKVGSTFQPYIEWAYEKGIVQGIGRGQFAPDRAITREEIAVVFINYAKAAGYTLPVTREAAAYADSYSIGSSYQTAVKAMQQAGIMMGGTNNRFNPKSSATRAEVSSMLHRYIKLTILMAPSLAGMGMSH